MPDPDNRARGFTLADLLVAIAVIGPLTGVAARVVRRSMIKAQINALVAESTQICKGATEYCIGASRYRATASSCSETAS